MSSDDFDFDFDENASIISDKSSASLEETDKEFMDSMHAKHRDSKCESDNDVYSFWFLVFVLLVTVFAIASGTIMIIKGKRKRDEYTTMGLWV
jgi:hypothetical protein